MGKVESIVNAVRTQFKFTTDYSDFHRVNTDKNPSVNLCENLCELCEKK